MWKNANRVPKFEFDQFGSVYVYVCVCVRVLYILYIYMYVCVCVCVCVHGVWLNVRPSIERSLLAAARSNGSK